MSALPHPQPEARADTRSTAALNFVFDGMAPQEQAVAGPVPRPMPGPIPRPAPKPPTPPAPHLKPNPLAQLGELYAHARPIKPLPARHKSPRLPSPPPLATGSGSGKGKRVAFQIDLSGSSEADDLLIQGEVSVKRPLKGKGKARMESIELSDDESDRARTSGSDVQILASVPSTSGAQAKADVKEEAEAPEKEFDTTPEEDDAMATILAIIPDVLPSHVFSLLRQPLYSGKAELVIEELLSSASYPKVEKPSGSKGKKREREEEKEEDKSNGRNYLEVKGRQSMGKPYLDAA